MKNINHAEKIKNVLSSELVHNLTSNVELLTKLVNNGFKGFENMNLEEVTNTYVDMFGWEGYLEAVSKINTTSVQSTKTKNNSIEYIAYADASYIDYKKEGYIGYVIKTTDGKLVYRDAKKVDINGITEGETLAISTLLDKALELNLDNIKIYGDNQGVIISINNNKKKMINVTNKLKKFNNVKIKWSSRDNNQYADMLCRLKRKGVNVTREGGKFDLDELLKISAKVGIA